MNSQPSKANTMLIFTRKTSEKFVIAGKITVTILKAFNGTVSVGIEAPRDITVNREEVESQFRSGAISPRNPILRNALAASGEVETTPAPAVATVH